MAIHLYSSSAVTFTHLQSWTGCNRLSILRYYHCQEAIVNFMLPDLQGGNAVGMKCRKADVKKPVEYLYKLSKCCCSSFERVHHMNKGMV